MNADRLLALYDRVVDAPDAIPRLRRFVLDLAVRGKLVEQDPTDEPAGELLKRIAAMSEIAPESGRSQRTVLANQSLTELPFALPRSWSEATLSELVRVVNGRAYKKLELLAAGTPVLRVGNLFTSEHWYYSDLKLEDDKYCDKGDLIYAWSASFGPFIWHGPRVIYHYHIWKLPLFSEADLDKRFLHFFLLQKTREIKDSGHGISMIHMTKEKMEQLAVPVPPLAEQRRIVAKVEQLMALLDQLEATRSVAEATRVRLTGASLARLTVPQAKSNDFADHVRFALDALPALTSRADQVPALRQAILNLAVRGKLVEQDPGDEPAGELLRHVRARPAERVSRGKLRRSEGRRSLSEANELFEPPSGWEFASFNAIAAIETNLVDPERFPELPHIAPDNVESWTGKLLPFVTVKQAGVVSGKHHFKPGALLYSKIRPNLAKVVKVDMEGLCSADMYPIISRIYRDYLLTYMLTADFVTQAVREANRVAMPKINQAALSDIIVPVPPLAEQHRIVVKVDALMALCDQLEAALAASDVGRQRLLEALMHEALAEGVSRREAA